MDPDHIYTLTIRDDTEERIVCELIFEASRPALGSTIRLILASGEEVPTVSVFEEESDARV